MVNILGGKRGLYTPQFPTYVQGQVQTWTWPCTYTQVVAAVTGISYRACDAHVSLQATVWDDDYDDVVGSNTTWERSGAAWWRLPGSVQQAAMSSVHWQSSHLPWLTDDWLPMVYLFVSRRLVVTLILPPTLIGVVAVVTVYRIDPIALMFRKIVVRFGFSGALY